MFIDGHAHSCGVYSSVEKIVEYLDANKIDIVVLCAGEPDYEKTHKISKYSKTIIGPKIAGFFNYLFKKQEEESYFPKNLDEQNKFVYKLAKRLPNRVINAYWADPSEDNCVEKLDDFYPRYKFKLIKMHQCITPFEISSEKSRAVFKWAEKHNLPVYIHLSSNKQAAGFVQIANEFQNLSLIVGHMMGLDYISAHIISTNVYFDLSAPQLYPPDVMKRALRKEGAQRLIFGSDFPYGIDNMNKVLERLKKFNLTDKQMALICGENLFQLLDLNRTYEFRKENI